MNLSWNTANCCVCCSVTNSKKSNFKQPRNAIITITLYPNEIVRLHREHAWYMLCRTSAWIVIIQMTEKSIASFDFFSIKFLFLWKQNWQIFIDCSEISFLLSFVWKNEAETLFVDANGQFIDAICMSFALEWITNRLRNWDQLVLIPECWF